MSWTAPMTAVATSVFTAAQFNTHVRDNLLETAPAKATAPGRLIVTTGLNSVAERVVSEGVVLTSETTTSTSFTDLATTGPSVTVTTGSNALVSMSVRMSNSQAGAAGLAAAELSGASSISAGDARALRYESGNANDEIRFGATSLIGGLTPGSNTFTVKYRVTAGTGTFLERRITVLPL